MNREMKPRREAVKEPPPDACHAAAEHAAPEHAGARGSDSSLSLAGGHCLAIDAGARVLQITRANGSAALTIRITESGPVLEFHESLQIRAAGIVGIEGQRVHICGREGLLLESGRDASIAVAGELRSEAEAHSIRARLGDVEVKANDDVRLRAERIRLNC